ncbi:MAG: ABC transporter ATP-binding protein [Pseudomonadota bacterium]
MTLLRVESLTVSLTKNNAQYHLVSDATFEVDRGETLAIVGESGSGKSVTALAIMGLLAPGIDILEGRILFEGADLTGLAPEEMRTRRGKDIAMVFQEPMTSLNPVRSIGAQIMEGVRTNLGFSKADARKRAIELLTDVGVSDPERRLAQYPHQFSGGMRQRVMIAIALSGQPKLIIADEPTTALDVTIQAQILTLLSRLCREQGVALILITHNLGIVAKYARRVNVMYGGRIVESGLARDIYRAPRHPYTAGLLASIPRLDQDRSISLRPIPGTPIDPFTAIEGCRFSPRCASVSAACKTLPDFAEGVACHHPVSRMAVA